MTKKLQHVDISNNPELLRIVEDVRTSNEPRVLQRDHEELAILLPARRPRKVARVPRGKSFTEDDPLWDMVGSGHSGLTDVSEKKHQYLADAYLAEPKRE